LAVGGIKKGAGLLETWFPDMKITKILLGPQKSVVPQLVSKEE